MSNYLSTYLKLVMKMKLNQTMYQLRKLSIFKKIIPSDIYGNDVLSFGYSAIFYISYVIKTLFLKILYSAAVYGIAKIGAARIFKGTIQENILITLFYLSVVIGSMISQFMYVSFDNSDSICVKALKLDAKKYTVLQDYLSDISFVVTAIIVAIFFAIFDINPMYAINVSVFCLGFRKLIKYINICAYSTKSPKHLTKNYICMWIILLSGMGLLVLYSMKSKYFVEILYSTYALIFGIVAYIVGAIFIHKTEKIRHIARIEITNKSIIDHDNTFKDINTVAYQIDDEKIAQENGRIYDNYNGIEYINKLFRYRFKHKYKKAILIRAGFILVIGIVGFFLLNGFTVNPKPSDLKILVSVFPVILIYAAVQVAIPESFNRFMFLNMDRYLMKQMVYADKQSIKQTLNFRIKQNLKDNAIQFSLVLLVVFSWIFAAKIMTLELSIKAIVAVLIMYVYISVKQLYMYMLLQPFTVGLKSKNVVYSILSTLESLLFWGIIILQIKLNFNIGLVALAICAIYTVVGYFLVLVKGDRTFNLKKS
ncbi:MAG: hypothetical protein E7J49_04395 [Finegoldia magna]|uniref:hypothetical protein n=1 Tax=Finegoldia magna TaxID=1260 RepID=UPI00290F2BB8|nr:hypothetical protein [Finegoldia magna]MDU7890438.1 hypothetical protein [Finegoldia magna]